MSDNIEVGDKNDMTTLTDREKRLMRSAYGAGHDSGHNGFKMTFDEWMGDIISHSGGTVEQLVSHCEHNWISADNAIVTGCVVCTKCKRIASSEIKDEPQDRYPLQSIGCQKIKGNCLCHRCHPDVKNLMSYCSGTYIAHGKPVKQAAIYQTLRESGNTHEPAEIIARIDQLIATKIVQKNDMYFTVALESAISALDNNAPVPSTKQGSNAVNWGE